MKVLLALTMSLSLLACNDKDVDGVLKVFKSFVLTEEDGLQITIPEGMYEAEFSYKSKKDEIELEIDNIYLDDDSEFVFNKPDPDNGSVVSYDAESRTEKLRLNMPASATGQPVRAEVVISNKILVQKRPQIFWDRCGAYYGTKGGLLGLLGIKRQPRSLGGRSGSVGSLSSHIYTVSSPTESQLSVAINLVHDEETVALFEGTERRRYRELHWEGKCGEYERPVIID